jgi:hypothetical protein
MYFSTVLVVGLDDLQGLSCLHHSVHIGCRSHRSFLSNGYPRFSPFYRAVRMWNLANDFRRYRHYYVNHLHSCLWRACLVFNALFHGGYYTYCLHCHCEALIMPTVRSYVSRFIHIKEQLFITVMYSRTRLRLRVKRHPVYNVRWSVIPINSSLLTITLYSWVRTTLVYNDTKY